LKRVIIFIEKCKLHLKCGVYEEERKLGVEVEIDIKVQADEFVDYEQLYGILTETTTEKFTYLEQFSERIVEKIRKMWNTEKIEVSISKRSLPFQNSMKAAGIITIWEK